MPQCNSLNISLKNIIIVLYCLLYDELWLLIITILKIKHSPVHVSLENLFSHDAQNTKCLFDALLRCTNSRTLKKIGVQVQGLWKKIDVQIQGFGKKQIDVQIQGFEKN